jgi:hypothetical protein
LEGRSRPTEPRRRGRRDDPLIDASASGRRPSHIICECGYDRCDLFIAVLKEEYEEVRDDPRQFIVRDEHVILDVELIVEKRDRFTIVAKRQGRPAEVATRTDPRGRGATSVR